MKLTPEDDHITIGALWQSLVARLRREGDRHAETPQEEADSLSTSVLSQSHGKYITFTIIFI